LLTACRRGFFRQQDRTTKTPEQKGDKMLYLIRRLLFVAATAILILSIITGLHTHNIGVFPRSQLIWAGIALVIFMGVFFGKIVGPPILLAAVILALVLVSNPAIARHSLITWPLVDTLAVLGLVFYAIGIPIRFRCR
jgi:hypothetical protein